MAMNTRGARYPRRSRPPIRSRGSRGTQHLSNLAIFYPQNNYYPRNGR